MFTLASWVLIAAALVLWAPGRSQAGTAVSRVAQAAATLPSAASFAVVAMSNLVIPCGNNSSYSYDTGPGSQDFAWCLLERDGQVWIEGAGPDRGRFSGRTGEPRVWFRDHGSEYVIRDPALVDQVREATRPLREVSEQMGALGAEMGRHGARMGRIGGRMGAVGARMALIEAHLAEGASARARRDDDTNARMRALRREMAELRANMEREQSEHATEQQTLSHRMSELSERHHDLLQDVRAKVRAICERARREGKAERPHVNA